MKKYCTNISPGGVDEEVKLACNLMLQKETPEGLIDEECGKDVEKGHAGLCW